MSIFKDAPPHPGLGQNFIPGVFPDPTAAQASMWARGAKAALRFAAEIARKAHAAGQSPAEIADRIEASTAVPFTHTRFGYTFETALIVEPATDAPCWLAWTIHEKPDLSGVTESRVEGSAPSDPLQPGAADETLPAPDASAPIVPTEQAIPDAPGTKGGGAF